jgi:chemotaxis response regulator CheB
MTGGSAAPPCRWRCPRSRRGETLRHGRVYVAPPDHHILICDGTLQLSHGPRYNGHRPAADPLFRGAAASAANRACSDGAMGA